MLIFLRRFILRRYIYRSMNKWDEKNSIEQEKNFSNCNESDQKDIMIDIKSDSTKNKCKDTGKIWTRKCPNCQLDIYYSDKYKLYRAAKGNTKCPKCCNKNSPDNKIYFRNCRVCGNRIDYVNKQRFSLAEKNNTKCKSCAMRAINRGRIVTDAARKNMSLAQTGRKHSENTLQKMRGENNGMYGVFRWNVWSI
jgi:hypothetical protein